MTDRRDRSDIWFWGWIIFVLIVMISGGAALNSGTPPDRTPVDDYTGVCNRPTVQLGC